MRTVFVPTLGVRTHMLQNIGKKEVDNLHIKIYGDVIRNTTNEIRDRN